MPISFLYGDYEVKTRQHITFEDCLWAAATYATDDSGYRYGLNPQEDRQMWAIQEGLRRIHDQPTCEHRWRSVSARKVHKCLRGCKIHPGDIYFREDYVSSYGTGPAVCAGCMAMILYYQQVYNLPVCFQSHWDMQKEEAVCLE